MIEWHDDGEGIVETHWLTDTMTTPPLGRGFKISYETPKSESLQLFHLGERTYDHILLLPSKTKGETNHPSSNILC